MKCQRCDAGNRDGVRYCEYCGAPFDVAAPPLAMPSIYPVSYFPPVAPGIRTGWLVGGGLIAAIFFGLFYWAVNYTWTERVWHDLGYGIGYWENVTRSVDPSIQGVILVLAIFGLIAMAYGVVSKR